MRHLALLSLIVSGCGHVYLTDDIDSEFDLLLIGRPSEDLHLPYVVGSEVRISADHSRGRSTEGWVIESEDPSILQVEESFEYGSATFTAVRAGSVDVIVRDGSGSIIHRREVEVRAPNRIELLAHGPLLAGMDDAEALLEETPRILEGGTATFLVRYYDDEVLLHGNGALNASAGEGIVVTEEQTYFFESREWLQLSPEETGEFEIRLWVNGDVIETVDVIAVASEEIAAVALQSDENGASQDELCVVLAEAYDDEGRTIFGVDYEWDLDGVLQSGVGDIYEYAYQGSVTSEITARFGEREASGTIHGKDGFVSSSNITCSAGGSSGAFAWSAVPAIVVLALRNRRRRAPK